MCVPGTSDSIDSWPEETAKPFITPVCSPAIRCSRELQTHSPLEDQERGRENEMTADVLIRSKRWIGVAEVTGDLTRCLI